MDLQPQVAMMFTHMGEVVTVDDVAMVALVDLPPVGPGPWEDDAVNSPQVTVRYDDLYDSDLYPIDNPEIIIGENTYRVIASSVQDGLVELIMQES